MYFCSICNLFDDDFIKKGGIYHCEGCGICRIGGKETSYHCDTCGCCLDITMKDNHKCVKDKLKQDCAVCMENMHNSTLKIDILKCGHAMHSNCFKQYWQSNQIACPLCKKSIIDPL